MNPYAWMNWGRQIAQYAKNPRVMLPMLTVLLLAAVAGGVRFTVGKWLPAIIIALGVVLVVLIGVLLWTLLARDREERVERGVTDVEEAEAKRSRESERISLAEMEQRFRRGLSELRESRMGQEGPYALPWYLVIGEQGGGKTAALRESGLEIPAQYVKLIDEGPTQDCAWWLTNQAVLLDTAGRFIHSDEGHVRKQWRALLSLIKRARPRRPIDGIIVAMPVTSLLGRSSEEIEEQARRLRRRLNEIKVTLGVEAPVYVVVTKSDLVEGCVETAASLPPRRLDEAFGWTNTERRFASASDTVRRGFEQVAARMEAFIPELVMREPDPARRRKLYLFPQEIEELAGALVAFVGRAFAPDVYFETPFLRGVYLTSARREGMTVSPLLDRLGHPWAKTKVDEAGPSRAYFLRDLFREIIVEDRNLALSVGRLGPFGRRVILGTAGIVATGMVFAWAFGAWKDWGAIRRIESSTASALARSPSLQVLDQLRAVILEEEEAARTRIRRMGLGSNLQRALDRARTGFIWAYRREFEEETKNALLGQVRTYGDEGFEALADLARDVSWLGARGDLDESMRPRLARYAPLSINETDLGIFDACYDSFVDWLPEEKLRSRIERETDLVTQVASTLLQLPLLEAWSSRNEDTVPPLRYAQLDLPSPEDGLVDSVPGAYTRATWEGLVSVMIEGVRRSGGASRATVETFRTGYVGKFDQIWRNYLLGVPLPEREQRQVKKSPYLAFLEQVDENIRADLPRDEEPPPDWMLTLHEVRREEPVEGEEGPPPWKRYSAALEQVAADVTAAETSRQEALRMALQVARGEPTSFSEGLRVAKEIVPREGDFQAVQKLREILSIPVLNGFSAVLAEAALDLDRRWAMNVGSRYDQTLSEPELKALYNPSGGDLARFQAEYLLPFYEDGVVKEVLGTRKLPLGPKFLSWLDHADRVSRALFPDGGGSLQYSVRLRGVPSKVVGASAFVTHRDLQLACPDGIQSFRYREGTQEYAFSWTPACEEVALRVWTRGADGVERELRPRKEWRGPLAFPSFLRSAQHVAKDQFSWSLRYPDDGIEIIADYRIRSGEGILEIAHRQPPATIRE